MLVVIGTDCISCKSNYHTKTIHIGIQKKIKIWKTRTQVRFSSTNYTFLVATTQAVLYRTAIKPKISCYDYRRAKDIPNIYTVEHRVVEVEGIDHLTLKYRSI